MIEQWFGVAVLVVSGGVGWLFSLHGRLSRHEAACEQRQKNLDERHHTMTSMLVEINRKLDEAIHHA